ncbi:hypothetical protein [Eggerthella lenta]|uniref:hypothetical protein n=1 Tax=Eggerthella lenta TaxID=84112 RepID=UPI00211BFF94|nr:hypothetical protein [Eggerthella lenta]
MSNMGCTFGAHFHAAQVSATAAPTNTNSDIHGTASAGKTSTAKNSNAEIPAAANTTIPAVNTFCAATISCKAPNMIPLPHPKHAPTTTSDHSDETTPPCCKATSSEPARKNPSASIGERHSRAFGQ